LLYLLLKKLLEDAIKNIRAREDEPKKRYRYYSSAETVQLISFGRAIWATQGGPGGGTFGEGVYVTKADDAINVGIGCPMTFEQRLAVVTALQIPRPRQEDPDLISGWVELEQTINGPPVVVDSGPGTTNSTGTVETIIRSPLVPSPGSSLGRMLMLDRPELGITIGFKIVRTCPDSGL
jgi:hypothetical protein